MSTFEKNIVTMTGMTTDSHPRTDATVASLLDSYDDQYGLGTITYAVYDTA